MPAAVIRRSIHSAARTMMAARVQFEAETSTLV
jgi:hypothetical protein